MRLLLETSWILGVFGLPHAELTGPDSIPQEIGRSAQLVLHLWKPYMAKLTYEMLVEVAGAALELAQEGGTTTG
jgi:hypothetical protein